MNKTEALKLALEALAVVRKQLKAWDRGDQAIAAIKAALVQPEQEQEQEQEHEPVGVVGESKHGLVGHIYSDRKPQIGDKLYAVPPKPDLTDAGRKIYQAGHNAGVAHHKQVIKHKWVGLTFVEVNEIEQNGDFWEDHTPFDFFQAIEAKLKEKNT